MSDLRIEPLERRHRQILRSFQNQKAPLVEYLRRFALRHQEKDLLSRTYLAVHRQGAGEGQGMGERVAGYFSLTTVSVEHAAATAVGSLRSLPRFPIPGVLLARLAVDERVQGQGLGRYLFEEALGRTLDLATRGPLTFRLLFTDATDEDAVSFYEQFALQRLSDVVPPRMVLDLRPLLAAEAP